MITHFDITTALKLVTALLNVLSSKFKLNKCLVHKPFRIGINKAYHIPKAFKYPIFRDS